MTNTRPQFTIRYPSFPESSVTTHPYTPAQNTTATNIPTHLTNKGYMQIFRLILQFLEHFLDHQHQQFLLIQPIQYNLTSSNIHTTQKSEYHLVHNAQAVTSNTTIQNNNVALSGTTPLVTQIKQNPTNTRNIQTNISNSNYHTTHPSAQPLTTVSNPTYLNSSVSISESIKPVDGPDDKYTPKEILQHIEARVTFSSGLQPTTLHE